MTDLENLIVGTGSKFEAFRMGFALACEASANLEAIGEDLRAYADRAMTWREDGVGRGFVPPPPRPSRDFVLDEDAALKLDQANPPFGSGLF